MKARRVRANSPNYTRRYTADSFIPGRPGAPHPAIPNLLQFYEVLQRLELDVHRSLRGHVSRRLRTGRIRRAHSRRYPSHNWVRCARGRGAEGTVCPDEQINRRHEGDASESADFVVTEEVDLKTFGNTADVDLPGALIQVTSNPAVISSMDGTCGGRRIRSSSQRTLMRHSAPGGDSG
jgi:hypothetical protein